MDYRVVEATAERLRVCFEERSFDVSVRQVSNPQGLPARDYVVAWTTGDQETGDKA
jgi:hypothetical protein